MNQSEPKESQVPQTVQISHLQLLINAVVLAYHRNAYTLKEAGTIWKALEFFINSGNAMMPQVHKAEQPPPQNNVNNNSVSEDQSASKKSSTTVHTIQPDDISINSGNAITPKVSSASSNKTNVSKTHVSPINQAGQKSTSSIHTIQPDESKQDSNLILNVVDKH